MIEYKLLYDAFELQNQLNHRIDNNWLYNRSIDDFRCAVVEECSEFLNSISYKWWKHQNIDYDNAKIELVDIFHFILSTELLMLNQSIVESDITLDDIVKALQRQYENFLNLRRDLIEVPETTLTLRFLELFLSDTWFEGYYYFFELVNRYFSSFNDFLKLYIAKNVLNEIRQEYGYKEEGKYSKYLNGIEDNKYLHSIVENIPYINITSFKNKIKQELLNLLPNNINWS